jgi:WD40 repeat protein
MAAMEIPTELLCGPIASFLDRTSINNLLLTSKVIYNQLQLVPCWPWPDAARFFNQGYSKRIQFSPNGQWLAYSDMRGRVSLWERQKGRCSTNERTSLDWINLLTFSASSTWLACGNTINEMILLCHLPSETWVMVPVKGQSNMQSMTFVNERLCISCGCGIMMWNLANKEWPTMGIDETLSETSPFRFLHMDTLFKCLSPINWIEPTLAASSNENQIHVWNLRHDTHTILLSPEAKGSRRHIMAMSQIGHEIENGCLAVAVKCLTTRSAFIELWSCIDNTLRKQIPLDYNLHVSSMVMANEESWIVADNAIDQVRIWRRGKHYACCVANPTRMDFTVHGTTIAWIGRGSMLWLRNLDTLVADDV